MLTAEDLPAISAAYGFGPHARLSGPADRGEQGLIWRLEDEGRVWAVKETLVPISVEQARLAYGFERRAAAAGIATPPQRLTVRGEVLITIREAAVRVFGWTTMAGPDRSLDAAAVGTLLARLHRAGGNGDGLLHPWYVEPVSAQRWREQVSALRTRSASFAEALEAQVPDLLRLAAWFAAPDPPYVLGHRDLWSDNLRRWSGPDLLVIDWDNCGPVPPAQELAMVLVEFGTEPDRARGLYDAYVAAGGPGRITGPSDFTMPAASLSHILEMGVRQWLDAADTDDAAARDRATGRVMEFVDDPLTTAQVTALVDLLA